MQNIIIIICSRTRGLLNKHARMESVYRKREISLNVIHSVILRWRSLHQLCWLFEVLWSGWFSSSRDSEDNVSAKSHTLTSNYLTQM